MVSDIGVGDIVRHFKGDFYKILAFAKHTETDEEEVVYQGLYPPFSIWVRPKDMFMEKVDPEKYPGVKQRYRFEVMTVSDLVIAASEYQSGKRIQSSFFEDSIGEKINFDSKVEMQINPIFRL